MQRLLALGPKEIQTGVWKVAKSGGMLWESGENVTFRELGAKKVGGAEQISTVLADRARDIVQAFVSGSTVERAYVGTDTTVEMFALSGGVWSKTSLGTWPTAGQYADLETWGSWLVATNGIDPVKVWKNGGALVDLGGVPFTKAKIIKRKQPFLMAFNTDNLGDTAAEWSSDSDIEDWTPTASNKAGNYVLRDLDSEVVAVVDLGPRLAVYSRNTLVLGTFVGGENVWGWTRAVSGIGAVSRRSVVELAPFNYGFTRDGIFKTDGNSFAWVDDPAMLRYIRDNADFSKQHLFWGLADSELKATTFYFLTFDNVWRSVSFYPDSGVFTTGNLQLTAGDRKEVFDWPLVAAENLKFGAWNGQEDHFDAPVAFDLKSHPIDFGSREMFKLHQLTNARGEWAEGSVLLTVRAHDYPEDSGTVAYQGALQRDNYFERDGLAFSYEFTGTQDFLLTGLEIWGLMSGVGK